MDKRLALFFALTIAILIGNVYFQRWLRGNAPPAAAQGENAPQDGQPNKEADRAKADPAKEKANAKAAPDRAEAAAEAADPNDRKRDQQPPAPALPQRFLTLGSLNPASPYQMAVTVTTKGAAVERVELNDPRFLQLEDRSGYLGHLAPMAVPGGVRARVVAPGSPASEAGLQAEDVITRLGETRIDTPEALVTALRDTKPGDEVEIGIVRGGKQLALSATLTRQPAEIIRPEFETQPTPFLEPQQHDPLSLLFTLEQVDNARLAENEAELGGIHLRTENWEVVKATEDTIEFQQVLPRDRLRVVKRMQLAKKSEEGPAYHLLVDLEVHNLDAEKPRQVAYRLDGPNGLPIEGWWYSYKNRISRSWGSLGVRDVAMRLSLGESVASESVLISSLKIAEGKVDPPFRVESEKVRLIYAGVDSQYFAAALLPQRGQEREEPVEPWLAEIRARLVGAVPDDAARNKLVNVSCRLVSKPVTISAGKPLVHRYQMFVGPKQRELLAQYGSGDENMGDLIYFGWNPWAWVATWMLDLLHFFHRFVPNYGIAIIMLTVLVRLCMFPLSRKQAINAEKMKEIQPDMKRIKEKYPDNREQQAKAMQELFRRHNFHPLNGCLPALVQLPIFMGLYRSLMIDVELRGAPLFSESIRWCSNLGAPDMLWRWQPYLPGFLASPTGWLGPYLNILPLVTVALMIVQQKMFTPPPTDEQSRQMQSMMKYTFALMALMFFTVASGLCLYFIASSLWSIGERKLLPKLVGSSGGTATGTPPEPRPAPVAANGAPAGRKRQKGRR